MKGQREGGKEMLVLDAGDLFFKKYITPIPENELKKVTEKGYLIVESLNRMGVDAIAIGDDDLTLGKEFLVEISKKANFPFLSTNVIDEESGKPLFQTHLLKEINGLKVGIFSLLSPDVFLGPTDVRRKGLTIQGPIEAAQSMAKELSSKTDLIILLSHLSYPKDVELAQTVPGIHLIVGSHTGVNLLYPPVIKNTVLLQTAPRGMYLCKFDLSLYEGNLTFYNSATKRSQENNLNRLKQQTASKEASKEQKAQWKLAMEGITQSLQKLQGQNEFTHTVLPLDEKIPDHPEIAKMIETYKTTFPEAPKPIAQPPKPVTSK